MKPLRTAGLPRPVLIFAIRRQKHTRKLRNRFDTPVSPY